MIEECCLLGYIHGGNNEQCCLLGCDRHFGGTYHLQLQGHGTLSSWHAASTCLMADGEESLLQRHLHSCVYPLPWNYFWWAVSSSKTQSVVTLKIVAICFFETSVPSRATRHHIIKATSILYGKPWSIWLKNEFVLDNKYNFSSYLTGNITLPLQRQTGYCCLGKQPLFIVGSMRNTHRYTLWTECTVLVLWGRWYTMWPLNFEG
jgi:hypothetical protein